MPNILPNLNGLANVSMGDFNPVPAFCAFDTANSVGTDSETSNIITYPSSLQVDTVPVGTVVSVQAKVHKDASWVTVWNSETDAAPVDRAYIQTYQIPYNFMQVIRVSGIGDVKAYATIYSTDTQG